MSGYFYVSLNLVAFPSAWILVNFVTQLLQFRAIFVWSLKMVSVSVSYLFYQPMDETIKTWTLRFPAKENPNMERALLDWPIVLQYDVKAKYRLISRKFFGHEFFFQRNVRLTNQKPRAFVSVRQTNEIALFPFVCIFCFVRGFHFQGHMKIAPFEIFLLSSIWFGYHTIDTNKHTHKQINKQINKWLTQSESIGLINNKYLWPLTSCLSQCDKMLRWPVLYVQVHITFIIFFLFISSSHIFRSRWIYIHQAFLLISSSLTFMSKRSLFHTNSAISTVRRNFLLF